MIRVPDVSDDASPWDLGDEPDGFWDAVHAEVAAWVTKYGGDANGVTE